MCGRVHFQIFSLSKHVYSLTTIAILINYKIVCDLVVLKEM